MKSGFARTAAAAGILALAACGGGGGGSGPTTSADPAYHLKTARFTVHQPDVLERIGAHHAYAKGLDGSGVRIGIDDTTVDYTQRAEFGGRTRLNHSEGAVLSYPHPFGDDLFSDIDTCRRFRTCRVFSADSRGDDEARNRWVREVVTRDGWPTRDDSVFVLDEHYSRTDPIARLLRWIEVPTPYGEGAHGTQVASVAAGRHLGVAPRATIIPVAQNLSDDQRADAYADETLRLHIARLPDAERRRLDGLLADAERDEYAKFDIINRSYGRALFDPDAIASAIAAEMRWYRRYLPRYLDATLQADRSDAEKTILVYAAGNEQQPYSGLGADLPYYIPELRGHSLSVVATDPRTGLVADYSNRCGPVPRDWNAARHGPHFCLAAPGTVRGLRPDPDSPGNGVVRDGLTGTSFAAPVVSGALALLMEHFRGTRGHTAVVKRMLDTADRSGRYADPNTYGAGHLDLEAALSPVGGLTAGRSARPLSHTALRTPAAFGSLARRAAGVELAAFDEQDFPFWIPLSALISGRPAGRSPIPRFQDMEAPAPPAPGLDVLELRWAGIGGDGSAPRSRGRTWVAGFGEASASLARRPSGDGWGYGFSVDDGGHLGIGTSGAFAANPRSGTVWASRAVEHELGGGWRLNATGTAALSLPRYGKDAMFRATPSILSAMAMRVGTESSGIILEQPLRAESGTARFRMENGRLENGKRLHDEYRIPLRPGARELRLTLRHDRPVPGGTLAIEIGGGVNAGHVPGERETGVGIAYRASW